MTTMKLYILTVLIIAMPLSAFGQQETSYQAGQRQPTWITLSPTYQSFQYDGGEIAEASVSSLVYSPIGDNLGMAFQIAGASSTGDELADLSGITDIQIHLSYYRSLGDASIVASLRANLPNGTQELSRGEFETLTMISLNQFDFRIPGFGVGIGINPGVTFAFPVTQDIVIGLGAAYQLRGGYTPVKRMVDEYNPGDELLFTGGVDVRISPSIDLSIDATYTLYGADKLGDEEFFEAGDKLIASSSLRLTSGFNSGWIQFRYRSRAKNMLVTPVGLGVEEAFQTLPDQSAVYAGYQARLGNELYASIQGEARFFGENRILPGVESAFGAGGGISFPILGNLKVPLQAMYHFGDLTGYEISLGLQAKIQ